MNREDLIEQRLEGMHTIPAFAVEHRQIAERQVESLLERPLNRCSVAWAKDMCDMFELADGYDTGLHEARDAIRDLREQVDG